MTHFALLSGLGHAMLVVAGLLVYVLFTRIDHQRRHPSAALAWVLGIVAFPYVALPLFLLVGSRKFARPLRQPHQSGTALAPGHAAAGEGPAWATHLLAGMDLAPAVRNAQVHFHEDGPEALQALLALIGSARHSLDVCTFVFGHDAVGERVAQALAQCAQRGVATRLLLDAVGSWRTPAALLRQLKRQGVQVRRFMPLLHNLMRGRTNLRNHRKLAVADGARLWSGGRNLASEYFMDCPGKPAWLDLSFDAEGPLAVLAQAQFRADWRAATGRRHAMRWSAHPAARWPSGCPAGPTSPMTRSMRCCSRRPFTRSAASWPSPPISCPTRPCSTPGALPAGAGCRCTSSCPPAPTTAWPTGPASALCASWPLPAPGCGWRLACCTPRPWSSTTAWR